MFSVRSNRVGEGKAIGRAGKRYRHGPLPKTGIGAALHQGDGADDLVAFSRVGDVAADPDIGGGPASSLEHSDLTNKI